MGSRDILSDMFQAFLKREMLHVLFSQGANVTINEIKKACHPVYIKTDMFT